MRQLVGETGGNNRRGGPCAGQRHRQRVCKKIHGRTRTRQLAGRNGDTGGKGDCLRGSGVTSTAARRFDGGPVQCIGPGR